jgi:hypothetical protein
MKEMRVADMAFAGVFREFRRADVHDHQPFPARA